VAQTWLKLGSNLAQQIQDEHISILAQIRFNKKKKNFFFGVFVLVFVLVSVMFLLCFRCVIFFLSFWLFAPLVFCTLSLCFFFFNFCFVVF